MPFYSEYLMIPGNVPQRSFCFPDLLQKKFVQMSCFSFGNSQRIPYQVSRDDNQLRFHTINDLLKLLNPVNACFADMSIGCMDKCKRRRRRSFYKREIDLRAFGSGINSLPESF